MLVKSAWCVDSASGLGFRFEDSPSLAHNSLMKACSNHRLTEQNSFTKDLEQHEGGGRRSFLALTWILHNCKISTFPSSMSPTLP